MAGARGVRVRVRPRREREPERKPQPEEPGEVEAALEESIAAAADRLTATDRAGLAAARVLARMVDRAARPAYDEDGYQRPLDNVTLPTFLKYLTAYQLTVEARKTAEGGQPVGQRGAGQTGLASVSRLLPGSGTAG